jgi:hypothetical protein
MNRATRSWVHGFLFVLGALICVGGISTRTRGAVTVGLIVAAVNLPLWQKGNKQRSLGDKDNP